MLFDKSRLMPAPDFTFTLPHKLHILSSLISCHIYKHTSPCSVATLSPLYAVMRGSNAEVGRVSTHTE